MQNIWNNYTKPYCFDDLFCIEEVLDNSCGYIQTEEFYVLLITKFFSEFISDIIYFIKPVILVLNIAGSFLLWI